MNKKKRTIEALTRVFLVMALAGALLYSVGCAVAPGKMDPTTASTETSGVGAVAEPTAIPAASVPPGTNTAPANTPVRPARGTEPEIVARVNGEPVTREELQRMLADPLARLQLELEFGVQDRDIEELERLALRKLINRLLVLQEARRRNFTVSEQDLDQAITALRLRFEDIRSFGVWMNERDLDDKSLFDTLRSEMLTERVRAALVEGVRPTEEQVQMYYEAHKGDLRTEEVWLQIIVVKDKATAEEIQAALRKGDDFGGLARQRSIGLRAAQSGDIGWVNSETLWPPLREVVGTLKAREAIGPLQRGAEFLIVRLEERRLGRTKSLVEARPEVEGRLLPAMQQEVLQVWLTEQEKKSKIEVFP